MSNTLSKNVKLIGNRVDLNTKNFHSFFQTFFTCESNTALQLLTPYSNAISPSSNNQVSIYLVYILH